MLTVSDVLTFTRSPDADRARSIALGAALAADVLASVGARPAVLGVVADNLVGVPEFDEGAHCATVSAGLAGSGRGFALGPLLAALDALPSHTAAAVSVALLVLDLGSGPASAAVARRLVEDLTGNPSPSWSATPPAPAFVKPRPLAVTYGEPLSVGFAVN